MDDPVLLNDLRPSKPTPASVYDDMFESYFNRATEPTEPSPKASSSSSTPPPVFDKPVFDDDPDAVDPFDAIPLFGVGSGGGDAEEGFLGGPERAERSEGRREPTAAGFDEDLLPGLGGSARSTEPVRGAVEPNQEAVGFDDLIPGFGGSVKPAMPVEPEEVVLDDGVIPRFGGSTHHHNSGRDDPMTRQESEPISSSKMSVSIPEDPFVILGAAPTSEYSSFGISSGYLDTIGMPGKSENTKVDAPANTSGRFQGSDMFAGFTKAMPSVSFASDKGSDITERRSVDSINSMSQSNHELHGKPDQQGSAEATADILPEMNVCEPSVIREVPVVIGFWTLNPFDVDDGLPGENKDSKMPDDVWLTVSDITLVTQPTSAPPPSRPPPPLATKQLPTESVTTKTYAHNHIQGSVRPANTPKSSQTDELEEFFTAKPAKFANGHPQVLNHEGMEQYASAGTASFMDQADLVASKGMTQIFMGQADFDSAFTRSQYQQEQKDDNLEFCVHEMEKTDEDERLENERRQKQHDEEQRRAEREREEELEREREKVRQREQEERKRHEKEREARLAVEKAIREARERAGVEARMRAENEARRKAERAAVQKVAAEARERAAAEARERAAKAAAEAKERATAQAKEWAATDAGERAAKESRERAARAAAEAREKAAAESHEKAAAEARAKAERFAVEKAAAEARRRAERAAFERVAAESRQRAANEARERAAAEAWARENQQRTATAQPDLESFFGIPSRSSNVPRSQTSTTNPFDVHPQGSSGFGTGTMGRTSSGSASPFMQPSSSNLMDDLSSIFGAPSSSAVFQELDGESEERRKARLERHQRTIERAAKALAEKNERDLQAQREQEERHRIGEVLDFEIKRWAAGKEGNIRALLSTLQFVLWPECGWRPISLTDLVTAASVKKEYRKATLCIHPDKVQQKGANLQQKYIAEKVFDLLKEAWNKFNSEELF